MAGPTSSDRPARKGLARLAAAIRRSPGNQQIPTLYRRQGVVIAYNSGSTPKSVNIQLGGSSTTIPNIRFLDSAAAWTPAVNDVVEVLVFGTDMIVLGKLRP